MGADNTIGSIELSHRTFIYQCDWWKDLVPHGLGLILLALLTRKIQLPMLAKMWMWRPITGESVKMMESMESSSVVAFPSMPVFFWVIEDPRSKY